MDCGYLQLGHSCVCQQSVFWAGIGIISHFSSENYPFYSHNISQYIASAFYRNVSFKGAFQVKLDYSKEHLK